MECYGKTSRHPLSSVTNHGLIKLLVQIYLARHNLIWEKFLAIVRVHWAPAIGHIGDREVKWSSSGLAGGRGEELEEGVDDQEEDSGEDVETTNPIEDMVQATMVIEEAMPLTIETKVGTIAEATTMEI